MGVMGMLVSLHKRHSKSTVGQQGPWKARTLLRILVDLIKDVEHDIRVIHQPMVCTLHRFDLTPLLAHGLLQPLHGTFSDPLVLVTIPYRDRMGIILIRETPWDTIMVQDQEKIVVRAFGRFRVRGRDQRAGQRRVV